MLNLGIYFALLKGGLTGWLEFVSDFQKTTPALVVIVIVGILNAQFNQLNKARLVFWRWSDPLPGSRAFSEYLTSDPRIDKDSILQIQNPLPTDPGEQNALWFKWYRECKGEPSVVQVHKEFLFTRDLAGLSIFMLLGFGGVAFWQLSTHLMAGGYLLFLVVQYLLVRRAAKNHGERFVTTVLAIKAAGDITN